MPPAARQTRTRELPVLPKRRVDSAPPRQFDLQQAGGAAVPHLPLSVSLIHDELEGQTPDSPLTAQRQPLKPIDETPGFGQLPTLTIAKMVERGAYVPPSVNPAVVAVMTKIDLLSLNRADEFVDGAAADTFKDDIAAAANAIRDLRPPWTSLPDPLSSLPVVRLWILKAQFDTCRRLLSALCSAVAKAAREPGDLLNSKLSPDMKEFLSGFDDWAEARFAELAERSEALNSALRQNGKSEVRDWPVVRPPRCTVEQPQARRVVPNTDVARAAAARQISDEATQRIESFKTEIGGRGKSVNPPASLCVTAQHVELALKAMLPNMPDVSADSFRRVDAPDLDGLFVPGKRRARDVETTGLGQSELRFEPAITLTPKGRQLLASYYARKYDADIIFSEADMHAEFAPDREFIQHCRQKTGDVVRSALYLGHRDDMHGSLLVYAREGDNQEALLWFDSIGADASALGDGANLAKASARFAQGGQPIKVFQHVRPLQKDYQSCWVFAMKTAVTLTGRGPDGSGGFKDFLVPDLIPSLEARRLNTPVPEGVNPVWALPEVVRASQFMESVLADAGEDLDKPLRGAKPGVTLRSFIEKYTYTKRDGTKTLDYIRQKGYRAIENAETQAWSQQIGKALGEQVWTTRRQNEFAEQIKTRVRGQREASVEINIGALQTQIEDPAQLIGEGLTAHAQIHQELLGISEMTQPALKDVEQRGWRAIGLLDDLEGELEKCFKVYRNTGMPVAIEKFSDQIMPQLQSSRDMAAALINASRDRERNSIRLMRPQPS